MNEIDFVITWVDGSDPAWQTEKRRYTPLENQDDNPYRYRDWDLLRFFFRGVEQFTPWVRKVHFITCGHLPAWLNTECEKLHVVRHEEYIPEEALPVFNSNAIEIGMHRIEGLAEQFVYFNDDTLLLRPMEPECFFKNGLPCDDAILSPVIPEGNGDICKTILNNMQIINRYFDKHQVISENPGKWINPIYGTQLLRTLFLMPWHHLPGFFNDHLPNAFLKSTFETVWAAEPELLLQTEFHRFRDYSGDVSQWLMRYWQFCSGKFVPASPGRGKDLDITAGDTPDIIRRQRYGMICLNDSAAVTDFETLRQRLDDAFRSILPGKSMFEK